MAPKNQKPPVIVSDWKGLDSWTHPTMLPPDTSPACLNCVASANGNVLPLRSPANFNPALSTGNIVLSGSYYDRLAGGLSAFDIQAIGSTNVLTYVTSTTVNTLVRSGQANAPWQSVNVNNALFRTNGAEYIQIVSSLALFAVGIVVPAAAPTVSAVGGGSLVLTTGVTVSYAYRNSATLHVGQASDFSNNSGPISTGTLRIAVTTSTQPGVDGIVLFITQDAGSVRYLVIDGNGDPIVYPNTTHNIDIAAAYNTNANVEETVFNSPPPAGATHISRWKNRLIYTGFQGATTRQNLAYSGFDQIFYGSPYETVPPLNIITIPNKGESIKGGIDTPVGWLGLSDRDGYLLTGSPTDKVDSGENTLQVTENLRQMGWQLGTRSPLTIRNTPFGAIFLDHNRHLQLWAYQGQPTEIAMGLRPDLGTIQSTDAALAMAQAEWFQTGDDAGFYALTASTAGSTNNRMWFVTLTRRTAATIVSSGMYMAGAPSDIAAQCVFTTIVNGQMRCLIGVADRLREILNFTLSGAGWPTGTALYFDLVANNETLWSTLYAMRHDATKNSPSDLPDPSVSATVMNLDGSNSMALRLRTLGGGSFDTLINRYGLRQKVRWTIPSDDAAHREIQNIHFVSVGKERVL